MIDIKKEQKTMELRKRPRGNSERRKKEKLRIQSLKYIIMYEQAAN